MIKISEKLKTLLETRQSEIVIGVEIYTRDILDISSISSPKNAIARFSNRCFTWENSSGDYIYDAKITDFPSVKTFLGNDQNEAEITLSNVKRGEGSAARFVLDNKIKGTWMVIRLIFPELEDESWIIWWGKCLRPGRIDNNNLTLSATQEIGNYKIQIPFRSFSSTTCPLTPGKGDCLGNEDLSQKSPLYQQMYEQYGTMLCPDRLYSTCIKLGNDKFYQGQRVVAVSGQFSYVVQDETSSNNQKNNKKKNLPTVKTESWSSLNQSDANQVVPIGFGRFQLAGIPFTWADTGTEVKSLQGFCEGRISDFDFIKCRNLNLTLVENATIKHYGDYGGSGTQSPDLLFGGFSGYNSKLAYLEVITTGSKPESVDNAPLITAVIRGMQIPVPDINGEYTLMDGSDNGVHITRFLLTDDKYGRIPTYRMEDSVNLRTSDICEELIEDRTQSENIVLPTNEYETYNEGYRRYRSTSTWTVNRERFLNYNITQNEEVIHPDFEQPWVRWYRPFEQQPLLPPQNILRRKYTVNGALQEKTPLLDFLQKRILPCFRGWINYNRNGKIEIRTREAADNGYLRADIPKDNDLLPINNLSKWRTNTEGYLVIGVGENNAEIRKIKEVLNSPGCNNLPISSELIGTITTNIKPISGGSLSSPGIGYIDIGGTVTPNSIIKLKFNNQPNDFYVGYVTDGSEDIPTVARMMVAYLNANTDFSNYLTAYIINEKPNRIYIRCEAGYFKLDKPLEYDHFLGEEVMRVQAVFENCNDIYSDTSASFDNIVVDSFSWNETDNDEINAYKAKFTSAVNDFHVSEIISRKSWDTIDQEAELNEEEVDLKFVDNYWQAAYILKATAIENIDGNIPFTWRSGISGFMLEMGDVVAIRHDSGDGVIRYTPVWINSVSYNLNDFTTEIEAKLYLSSSFDLRVQPVDPFLTVTLNPNFFPGTPEAIGTSGGYGIASDLKERTYPNYEWIRDSRYSPQGEDLM